MDDSLDEELMPLVSEDELPELEALGYPMERPAGDTFFREGERGDYALLIRKGYVKVTRGDPPRIIDVRGPGEIVGEMGVFRKKPRMASIFAWNDVEALYLPGPKWKQFVYEHPRAFHALLIMAQDMADRQSQKTVDSELAVEQQLAKRLTELADFGLGEPAIDGGVVFRGVSQADLASLLGGKKTDSVKKVIARLKLAGIAETGREVLIIRKLAELRAIADGNLTVT